MTTEYGIWSDAAGGIIESGFYNNGPDAFILTCIDEYVAAGETDGDLSVVEVCGQHTDQPADECQECE